MNKSSTEKKKSSKNSEVLQPTVPPMPSMENENEFGHLPIERAQMLAQITAESILHNAQIEPEHEAWEDLYYLILCGFCNGYNLCVMQHDLSDEGLLSGHEAELRLF